ncbi:glycine cleavage system protein GcvH [Melghirimyces algeriensis]|uniref:Glycine cleavage system H protein n=1 Tax=Melghirimyces algeriensis TaxID=910412 RepID=A0A521ER09_9BACL|nr:glycine cleavage system protein GcvH [Melghirimyces algeriensis]SMO85540.1 glycine cleavage system H protein [Melghirimyces algeriensis]
MSQVMDDLYYTKEHEWVRVLEGKRVQVGISDFAQEQLGEIVFIELPEVGSNVEAHEVVGSVESVKAVSDLFCPVPGKVLQVNEALEDSPEIVNDDPYHEGWFMEIELEDIQSLNELWTSEQYVKAIEGEET